MKLKFNINSNVVKSKNNLEIARKYHHYDNVESIHVAANDDVYHIEAVVSVFNHPQKCSLDIKDNQVISREYQTLIQMLDVMGFVHEMKQLSDNDIVLYEKWLEEKANKNFDKADELRGQLQMRGII